MKRRNRSYGLHAETQEEYLSKLDSIDKEVVQESKRTHKSYSCDLRNIEYRFGDYHWCEVEDEERSPLITGQVLHRILFVSDDSKVSHSRIYNILNSSRQNDSLTQSTDDEAKPYLGSTDTIMPLDLYVIRQVKGRIQHTFQIWIQNIMDSFTKTLFQDTYYSLFEAVIYCADKKFEYPESVDKILALNNAIRLFRVIENDEFCLSPLKRVKISSDEYKGKEYVCGSLEEVVGQLLN